MKHQFAASLLAFSLLLAPTAAFAASTPAPTPNRYFVQTTKSFWRNAFGARNVFEGGFTADLTDLQLRLAKFAGLKPIAVKKFNILAASVSPSPTPSPTAIVSPTATPKPSPTDSEPWGVKYILGNTDVTKGGGKGVVVAVLDTGVDGAHPDLADRVTVCADYADLSKSLIDKECNDANGHGTHMAGIVAADGGSDGSGIWGVAPQADLQVYKVCHDDGSCLSDDIAMGIKAAVDNGANIITLGLGGENDSSFIDDAINYAKDHDVLVIAAAGNDGPYDNSMDWPALNPNVVAVGALNPDDSVADFSSRGDGVEFAAPGVNIESTYKDDNYAVLSGTSMAAPHIAGLAARIWQKDAKHPADATHAALRKLAHDITPMGDDTGSGYGAPTL